MNRNRMKIVAVLALSIGLFAATLGAHLACTQQVPSADLDAGMPIVENFTNNSLPPLTSSFAKVRHPPLGGSGITYVDSRTPAQIAQAACSRADGTWACPKLARTTLYGAGLSTSNPTSWSVPEWDFDPQNTTGCASDGNTCTSRTCGGGTTGPCLTWRQVRTRLGVVGNGSNVALGSQQTLLHWVSGQTGNTDPIDFVPSLPQTPCDGGSCIFQEGLQIEAALPTPCVGTLASLQPKTRTWGVGVTPTNAAMLSASSACFTASDLLVVNTTRGTQAMTSLLNSANDYYLTQPVVVATGNEDDTWANGDTINVYALQNVYITSFGAGGSAYEFAVMQNLVGSSPDGPGLDFLNLSGTGFTESVASTFQGEVIDRSKGCVLYNSTIQSAGSFIAYNSAATTMEASATHSLEWGESTGGCAIELDSQVLRPGGITVPCQNASLGDMYNSSFMLGQITLALQIGAHLTSSGPIFTGSRLEYNTDGAVGSIFVAPNGGLQCSNAAAPFQGNNGCSWSMDGSTVTSINCGIPITTQRLDFCPAGADAFCNLAWGPQGCSIGKGNF
jgi:hypothetical protein